MPTDNGYSNQKKKGLAQSETVHNLGSEAYGKVITPKSLYEIVPSSAIVSVTDIKGAGGLVEFWNIELTAHGASKGNIFRIDAGSLINTEYEIVRIVDANNFYILPITDTKPAPADTGVIMGWVTQKLASDGSINVTTTTAPTSYNLDGNPQTVEQDTVTPANNRALPNLNFIIKDGVQVPVTKDTGLPSNTVGMPVEIVAASGTPINITAGDINVQLSDQGVNFDSLRVGDGSGNYVAINASLEMQVRDDDANISLVGIESNTQGIADAVGISGSTTSNEGIRVLGSDGVDDFKLLTDNTGILQTNDSVGNASLSQIDTSLNTLTSATDDEGQPVTLGSTAVKILAVNQSGNYSFLETEDTGELRVSAISSALPTGAATEAKQDTQITELQDIEADIEAMSVKLPATLGQKTSANSFAVVLASDQSTLNTSSTPATVAGTITNAQITVGTSAVRATVAGTAPNAARKKLMIKPSKNNTGAIYLGSSSVTTANGLEIIGPDRLEFEFDSGDYYLISDTAAQVVEIVEKV